MSDTFTVRYSELRISFYARVDEEREERKGGREREGEIVGYKCFA